MDLTYKWQQFLVPFEVKSGAKGSLRSLHEFMDIAPHDFAVRFLGNRMSMENVQTRNGKAFHLLNLPYFAVSQIERYLTWMQSMINNPVSGSK